MGIPKRPSRRSRTLLVPASLVGDMCRLLHTLGIVFPSPVIEASRDLLSFHWGGELLRLRVAEDLTGDAPVVIELQVDDPTALAERCWDACYFVRPLSDSRFEILTAQGCRVTLTERGAHAA